MKLALLVWGIEALQFTSYAFGILGVIITIVMLISIAANIDNGTFSEAKNSIYKWLVAGLALIFIGGIIPSKTTSYVMVAAYTTQIIAESNKTAIIGDKVLLIINKKLDELIKDGK
ncbi:MAG: hypothetical protein KDC82_04695 [Bacteroidetes bacterium]|nr:hypothetical protein [Bacteroidota bacterium]